MDRGDATSEHERRLVSGHPVPVFLRRQRAALAGPFWSCPRGLVRLIERDVRAHMSSALCLSAQDHLAPTWMGFVGFPDFPLLTGQAAISPPLFLRNVPEKHLRFIRG